ncbi:MAG: hypothetical protein RLY86_2055 [Pseudomonadota bacterium]|jgi:hypothetical protein
MPRPRGDDVTVALRRLAPGEQLALGMRTVTVSALVTPYGNLGDAAPATVRHALFRNA